MHLDINDIYTEETESASIQKNDKDKFYVEFAKYSFNFSDNKHEHKTIVVNIDKQRITDIDNYKANIII